MFLFKATAQIPVISSFTPASGPVGTMVTITGSNFSPVVANNIVYFGAVRAVVSAASTTSLTVIVPAGTTYQPVTVTANGFTGYAALPFIATFAGSSIGITSNSFAARVDYVTGQGYNRFSIGDLDGDGKPDLAIVNWDSSTVSILRNTGSSGTISFANKVNFAAGGTPADVAIGDVDGDGKPDLAIANFWSNSISVLRNTSTIGAISFAAKVEYVAGTNPQRISISDLSGDGKSDLVFSKYNTNTITVLQNTSVIGAISFAAKAEYSTGGNSNRVAIGDLDGDGKPDMAVANSDSGTASILRNTSSGGTISFAARVLYATGGSSDGIAIGDMDGDRKPDLVLINWYAGTASVLRNITNSGGAIAFATKVEYAAGGTPDDVAIGDLNGDGKPDLAVTNYYSNTLSVLRNTGSSGTTSFATKVDYVAGNNPYCIAIGDLDGDGKPELAETNSTTASASVSIFRNQTDNTVISSFTPTNAAVGTTITITGANFTGATAVTIGGIAATSFTVVSDATIIATIPAVAGGSVVVTTPKGTATLGGFYNGPAITSFSPASGPVGTTVTITGSNFSPVVANNIVYFGAVKAVVSAASATSLIVTVPFGTTYQPITVTTTSLTAYASKPFIVTFSSNGAGFTPNSFAAKAEFATGNSPLNIAIGDVDGDGKADIVVANYDNNTVSVLRNTSTGGAVSYAAKVDYATGSNPCNVVIGDIDRDGKPDLSVANNGSGNISILKNASTSGVISFVVKTDFATGSSPYSVAIRDMDGDGKPDLAVANGGSGTVSVLRNLSTGGTVSFAAKVDFTTGSSPYSVAAGDVNGDGKPDLAVANYSSNTVSILKNTSISGTFAFDAKVDYATGINPHCVAIGDVDGDEKPDLAVGNYGSNTVSVLRNTGTSGTVSFAAKVDNPTGTNPFSVAMGDVDGDGKPDLAVTNINSNTASVYRNTCTSGTVSFAAKADYATGINPYGIAIADMNGDGKPDLAVANISSKTVSILRNGPNGPVITSFTPANAGIGATITVFGFNFTGATAVSFGGIAATTFTVVSDTVITAVVGASASGSVSVTTPGGTATLGGFYSGPVISSFSPASGPVGTTVITNGSGFSPVAANNIVTFGTIKAVVSAATTTALTVTVPAGTTYQPITVSTNNLTAYAARPFMVTFTGGGVGFTSNSFAPKINIATASAAFNASIGDLDGDGKLDIILSSYDDGAYVLSRFRNTGTNGVISFDPEVYFNDYQNISDFSIGDLNGDGKPDIAVANGTNVSVLRNTSISGTISFAAKVDYPTGFYAKISIGDLDGDGKPDIVVANGTTVSVLRNTGSGGAISFAAKIDFAAGPNAQNITIGDLDGDGKPDLAIANGTTVSVFRNISSTGVISFAAKIDFAAGPNAQNVTIGDLDGDGKPDLATANGTTVSVFRNTSSGGGVISFGTKVDYPIAGSYPAVVSIGDLDGDTKPDLAASNNAAVSVLRNTSSGGTISFDTKVDYPVGIYPGSISIGDLDGDGKVDITTQGGIIAVLRNQVTTTALTLTIDTTISTNACVGGPLDIPFIASGPLNASNVFTAQLSDYAGIFTNPVAIGILPGNNSGILHAIIPSTTSPGDNYRIRILSSNPAVTSITNANPIIISNSPSSAFIISGNLLVCPGSQTYIYNGVSSATTHYNWTLSGGGIVDTTIAGKAVVNWTTPGIHTLILKLSNNCGSSLTRSIQVTVDNDSLTGSIANMLPLDGNYNLSFPVTFSWSPVTGATSYDLYIWLDTASRPASPTISNITVTSFIISVNSFLQYEKNYKWQVVAKKLCFSLPSAVQTFKVRDLPNIIVSSVSTNVCAGNSLQVPFTVSSTLDANNVFTAQLSNSSGSFVNPVTIGTLSGNTSGTINSIVPSNITPGTNYRVRIVSSSPFVTSLPNTSNISINQTPGSNFVISGNLVTCVGLQTYTVSGATGMNNQYNWILSGGGVLDTSASNAKVTWTIPGTYTLSLMLSNNCGNSQVKSIQVDVDSNSLAGTFPNMLPAGGNTNLSLPVTFSWFPIDNATNYDLYIWPDTSVRPTIPTAANINGINYTIYSPSVLQYEKMYKWQVVAKKACFELLSPVQTFKLRYLPDVIVSSITPAATGFSGQSFSINWQVKNIGSGGTLQGQWYDRVYLSADTILDLNLDIYLGVLRNVSELTPNASYSQTASFTLPDGISNNYYVFVTTDVYDELLESDNNNNRAISTAAAIQLTPPPDLLVSSIVPPNFVFSGQNMAFTWKVTNRGIGVTRTGSWTDAAYLSKDTGLNVATAIYLGNTAHRGILNVDSSYTSSKTVRLPDGIFGKYYLYIKTDVSNEVYEHASEGNNATRSDSINIILTPPIDLIVTQLTATPASVGNKENVNIQWHVENAGGSATENRSWVDNIYLSKDTAFKLASATLLASVSRPVALNPGDGYDAGRNVAVPDNISGNFYVYVTTDAANQVYEYNFDSNNTRRIGSAIQILSPDLIVENIIIPFSDTSGQQVEVKWRIKNNTSAKIFNTAITDRILMSTSALFNTANSIELKRITYNTGDLSGGDTLGQSAMVKLPDGFNGNYYIYIQTDISNKVFEAGNESNNTTRSVAPILINLSPWPDLQVSNVQIMSDSVTAGSVVPVTFKVINKGVKQLSNTNTWSDKLYISVSPRWDSANSTFLKEFIQSGTLLKDSFYIINTVITVPAQLAETSYYFYVVTDAKKEVYEYTDENNNTGKSNLLYVMRYPPIDIIATSFTGPDSAATGKPVTITWGAQNSSMAATLQSQWKDGLYLSADTLWNSNDDVFIKEFAHTGVLQAAQPYNNQQAALLPNNLAGNYYLFLVIDHTNVNRDVNPGNNYKLMRQAGTGNPLPIHIALTPPSDLIVTSFTVPFTGQAGQPMTLKWKVKNNGTGVTNAKPWTEKFYLSANPVIGGGSTVIGSYVRLDSLLPATEYADSLQVFLPLWAQGNYFILMKTDANNTVYEHTGENNNTASVVTTINKAPISDLIVSEITAPDSAIAGENVTIQWKTKNIGQFPASGYLKDAVYLSEDTIKDVNDILLVSKESYINIAPQTETMQTFTGKLKGASLKNYYVLVHTDMLNNIYESSDSNNTNISLGKIRVNIKSLPVNDSVTTNLINNTESYYKIVITDTLKKETLLVGLKANSLAANEMYIKYEDVPSRAVFDFGYTEAYNSNQEIIIPELKVGTYYVLVYGNTPADTSQQIILSSFIRNFEIRSVNTNKGGNTGTVSTKITGSKFTNDMIVSLKDSVSGLSVTATTVKYVNQATIYVTFNFTNTPTGLYDVVVTNPLTSQAATLKNGFEILPGSPPLLSTYVRYPASARPNNIISMQIEFSNDGNIDIPLTHKALISRFKAPIGFSLYELNGENYGLNLKLVDQNEPLEVLRPGARATIIVYVKAVNRMKFLLLK